MYDTFVIEVIKYAVSHRPPNPLFKGIISPKRRGEGGGEKGEKFVSQSDVSLLYIRSSFLGNPIHVCSQTFLTLSIKVSQIKRKLASKEVRQTESKARCHSRTAFVLVNGLQSSVHRSAQISDIPGSL